MSLAVICLLFLSSSAAIGYGAENDKEDARYALYFWENENKQIPILLDIQTGKIWQYSEGEGVNPGYTGAERPKFKGLTVEGLVYSPKDSQDLDKQIDSLHTNGFVNKELRGFKEIMFGEFSYSLDLSKIQGIYERLKSTQPKKE